MIMVSYSAGNEDKIASKLEAKETVSLDLPISRIKGVSEEQPGE